jgi:hypothetical protein
MQIKKWLIKSIICFSFIYANSQQLIIIYYYLHKIKELKKEKERQINLKYYLNESNIFQ